MNLRCGLAWYVQWLDNGANCGLDPDPPKAMALRRRQEGEPVMVLLKGVLMYLNAAQVDHLLREFADNAPPGSQLLCDALSWMAAGYAALHPSVRHTEAQFHWGPKRLSNLTCSSFRTWRGVPLYDITRPHLND